MSDVGVEVPWAEVWFDGEKIGRAFYMDDPRPEPYEHRCRECHEILVHRREGHVGSDPTADVMRTRCFAHIGAKDVATACGGGKGESFQHETAKWMIERTILDWKAGGPKPTFTTRCSRCGTTALSPDNVLPGVDEILVDQQVPDADIGKRKPDVFVRYGDNRGAIEVFYRHAMEDEKLEEYKALTWWAEINYDVVSAIEWPVRRASWLRGCQECIRRDEEAARRRAEAERKQREAQEKYERELTEYNARQAVWAAQQQKRDQELAAQRQYANDAAAYEARKRVEEQAERQERIDEGRRRQAVANVEATAKREDVQRVVDADVVASVRRGLAAFPVVDRLADVCPGCGQHMIADDAQRLQFLRSGGTTVCPRCGISKAHNIEAVATA